MCIFQRYFLKPDYGEIIEAWDPISLSARKPKPNQTRSHQIGEVVRIRILITDRPCFLFHAVCGHRSLTIRQTHQDPTTTTHHLPQTAQTKSLQLVRFLFLFFCVFWQGKSQTSKPSDCHRSRGFEELCQFTGWLGKYTFFKKILKLARFLIFSIYRLIEFNF